MAEAALLAELDGHVLTVTINRPEAMNSWTNQMCAEFADLWKRIKLDGRVHAVVLRAADGRAFSTGVDVKEEFVQPDNIWNHTDGGEDLGPKQNKCWKPVICAVHGLAAGGAFYWINEADIVICSDNAAFTEPHSSNGLTPVVEPMLLARRGVPFTWVMRLGLLGRHERWNAQRALELGLVTEVVPQAKLMERAHELADLIRIEAIQVQPLEAGLTHQCSQCPGKRVPTAKFNVPVGAQ